MAREVVPSKVIVTVDEKGEVSKAIVQYRIRDNGKLSREFFTMSVKGGIDIAGVTKTVMESLDHVCVSEQIEKFSDTKAA